MNDQENELLALQNIGLSRDEAALYLTLVTQGGLQASTLARISGVSRVMAYRTLNELESKKLIKKVDKKGEITRFFPQHPFALSQLTERKKEEYELAERAVESVTVKLASDFARVMGQPGIRVLSGINGISESLKDIEQCGQTLYLIRTPKDAETKEIRDMIRSHVLRRAQKGIHTKVIAPFLSIYTNKTLEKDKDRLVERRFISETELLPEGQVSIYGDKVALISYHSHDTIVTIIQDRAIASTFYSLFNYMWNNSEKFTEQAIKEMQNRLSVEHNL